VLKGQIEHIDQPKRYLFSVYKKANIKYNWFAKKKRGGKYKNWQTIVLKILNYFKHLKSIIIHYKRIKPYYI
jgi:hypothetical protein